MLPHEERVVKELEELEDKCIKLDYFLHTDIFSNLEEADQVLLTGQLSAMISYSTFLQLRINRFN